jgi:hypothetical protein
MRLLQLLGHFFLARIALDLEDCPFKRQSFDRDLLVRYPGISYELGRERYLRAVVQRKTRAARVLRQPGDCTSDD